MCTHQKYVFNKYTGQRIFVKCGKCESCKQEKADRLTARLNNHSICSDKIAIFSTLTYDERFVPYVTKKDIENNELHQLPVYRDFTCRFFRDKLHVYNNHIPIDEISLVDKETGEISRSNIYFRGNLWKKGRGFLQDRMGIIYYKDLQDFKKRLRILLQRKYGRRFGELEIFSTSEYGETHFRPHFHILVYCQQGDVERVISAICKTWYYADNDDVRRATQIGLSPAAYVSSYVNSPSNLPDCFTAIAKTKYSFSPSIGVEAPIFSLSKILEDVDGWSLSYTRQTIKDGRPTLFVLPIPKYVINRYFPLFKGLCRCSVDEVDSLLRFPWLFFRHAKSTGLSNYNKRERDGQIVDDMRINYVRIKNARDFYLKVTGKTIYDYAIDYQRVWNCYKNTIYKLSFDQDIPMSERYDNINDLIQGYVKNDSLSQFVNDKTISNPNEFSSVKQRSLQCSNKYHAKTKISKENNFIRVNFLNKNL